MRPRSIDMMHSQSRRAAWRPVERVYRPSAALQHGPSYRLFSDAETTEDFSQKIVGREFSRDFAQRLLRES